MAATMYTMFSGFDVLKFLTGTFTPEEKATAEWIKVDAVVSTWIYNTISEALLERVLNSELATAHDTWVFIEQIFQDNKLSKTMELTAELRGLVMGDESVEAYFRKIDRIANHLQNLGSTVEDKDLVMYAVNGLNGKYPHAAHIIIHRHPFPDFNIVRSMLLMEEMTSNRFDHLKNDAPANPSNPIALIAHTAGTPPAHNLGPYYSLPQAQPALLPSPNVSAVGLQSPAQPNDPQAFYAAQPSSYGSFVVDPQTQTQETMLPNAFGAMTLQDYEAAGWHMDTGDYLTRRLLLRCDSNGDLYPLTPPSSTTQQSLITSPVTWHQRLGHPGHDVFRRLVSDKDIICNKTSSPVLCHACQLGKHVRLPFSVSSSNVNAIFDIIHSDLWTSPVTSLSGLKYYIIFLDHYSHYV
ncbi:uncharacterized protein [Rutidosis leptorrhynchoides]|uniref:uncharacterized protein n=1 Tax=Rutidosis leptorrhynchoides TaxID=125765 RepID=UPI003A98E487